MSLQMLLFILWLVVAFSKPCVMGFFDTSNTSSSEIQKDHSHEEHSNESDNPSDETKNEVQDWTSTADSTMETSPAPSISLHSFPKEFSLFESRMKSFIEYVKQDQMATIANMKLFIDEVDQYVVKLPSKNAYTITVRNVCHCNGHMRMPCPYQCIYSCYHVVGGKWRYDEDCRGTYSLDSCKCNINSMDSCRGNLNVCLNQTRIQPYEDAGKLCSHYSIDKKGLVKSFELIQSLLLEPLKIHFRCVESRLTFLRKASISIDSLTKITDQTIKEQSDPTYASDSQLLLASEKKKFRQMKRNITLEMIRTQSEIDAVAKNVDQLKEDAFAKINRSIKEYSCCLKSHDRDFAIDDYDCSGIGEENTGKLKSTEYNGASKKEEAITLNRIIAKYSNSAWKPTDREVSQLKNVIDLLTEKLNKT
ncbi:hypothetical protein GE061_000552 [Apolygus lucorum]|uniref:Uncharacterized protein n=1 Tax=Apolygus lucorum TaxID=248454 RepID=A0A8S9Y4L1_APOLU|nr:hypothetical protein GE061_000552 [Apolygus lucorum]